MTAKCEIPSTSTSAAAGTRAPCASYLILQGLAGSKYDAVDKLLYIEPSVAGDFRAFFAAGR